MKQYKYDYAIVGAGLFGSVFANIMHSNGKKCLVVEKRPHIGGNSYSEIIDGIVVHKYGAHIFHTDNQAVWEFVNSFCPFSAYSHEVVVNFRGTIYNLPFNMNTFYQMWKVSDPEKARRIIEEQTQRYQSIIPRNLQEQALKLVGEDLYEVFIKGYSEKQWGRDARELPPQIITRIPLRFTYSNAYFTDKYQGLPDGGYSILVDRLLSGIDVLLSTDYFAVKDDIEQMAAKIVYSGCVDEYFGYRFGCLEYRSLRFETSKHDVQNYQGASVMNFTDAAIPFTRIIEHKNLGYNSTAGTTVITHEFPDDWTPGKEPYYPINDMRNNMLYSKYMEVAETSDRLIFGGRLGDYKYYDMDDVIESAMNKAKLELNDMSCQHGFSSVSASGFPVTGG